MTRRFLLPVLAMGVLAAACSTGDGVETGIVTEVGPATDGASAAGEPAAESDDQREPSVAPAVPDAMPDGADDVLPDAGPVDDTPDTPRLVAIVGDSISVRSEDEYLDALPQDIVNVEAVTGAGIVGMRDAVTAAIAMDPDVLVIELGTNDAPRLERQDLLDVGDVLDEAAAVPCVRWVSIAIPDDNDDRFNATLALQAAARPGVEVVDWAALVERFPPFLDPDGVHPTEAGQLALAAAVATSINDCDAQPD